jgi:DNA replication initiation complex subunit (GINS family)
MGKSFDDLFNEFFNRKPKTNEEIAKIREEEKKFFENLSNFIESKKDESLEKMFDQNLGEPDEIENFQDGDLFFERRIWNTPTGQIMKLLVSDDPSKFIKQTQTQKVNKKVVEKTLEIQLQEAVEAEDFEKAAQIRDLINPPKKRRGRKPKSEKND